MPFLKEDKILFLHIPKTGGTSIEKLFQMTELENFCSYKWDMEHLQFIEKYGPRSSSHKLHNTPICYEPQHYTIDVLKELMIDYDLYFKFTFVRNPYTRILSEYFYSKGIRIKDSSEFNSVEFHNWCTEYLSVIDSSHKEPQVNFIDSSVNFIGRYENFIEDIELLKSKLIDFSKELIKCKDLEIPYLNQTNLDKKLLIKNIHPETKQIIYSIYKSDFTMFLYDNEIE